MDGWETGQAASGPRRWRFVVGGVVVVAALGLLGRVQPPQPEADLPIETDVDLPGGPLTPQEATTGIWSGLPAGPLSPRVGHSAVWTGNEMIVWGGTTGTTGTGPIGTVGDGAAFRPAAQAWRPIAAPDLVAREGHVAAWTGREMVVWGGSAPGGPLADGAAYDPASDTWRPLAPSPLTARAGAVTAWTGRELLVLGGNGGGGELVDGAAYDPASDTWRPLAPSPFEGTRLLQLVWTGHNAIAWATPRIEGGVVGAAYDPAADAWTVLTPPEGLPWFTPVLVPAGRRVLAWGAVGGIPGPSQTFMLDPDSGEWSPVDGPPLRWETGAGMQVAGTAVVLFTGDGFRPGAIGNLAIPHWRALPQVTLPTSGYSVTWAGDQLLVWGGEDGRGQPTSAGAAWSFG